MANSLVSPGVQVTVIDESNYAPTAVGTVPFIVMATAQDKTNNSGTLAAGTTKANAGKVFNVGDQRSLVSQFGMPYFEEDSSGNRIYGSELSEYGLWAAHNILNIISSAYVVRADVDLAELDGSKTRPFATAEGGTLWLDTSITSWGVFEWDQYNQAFVRVKPSFLATADNVNGGIPAASYGNIGDYAVVGFENANNPMYYKNYNNAWVLVGGSAWQNSVPTIQSSNATVTTITPGDAITINGITITASGATDISLVSDVSTLVDGVSAAIVSGKFTFFANSAAMSNGSDEDGKILISNVGAGTILTELGIASGTYARPTTQFSKHSNIPQWKTINSTPRPSGSVWVKTTNYNYGANIATYRRNAVTEAWDLVPCLTYASDADAIYNLDPTKGGLNIARNSLYAQYDVDGNGTVSYKIFIRSSSDATTITGTESNPTFTPADTFTISVSQTGSNSLTTPVTITVPAGPNNTAAGVVARILAQNIPNLTAGVTTTGNITLTHTTGGVIVLMDDAGSPLEDAGITTDIINVRDGNNSDLIVSNWIVPYAPAIIEQNTAPQAVPTDGRLWYYSGVTEADILINDNNVWKGYQMVAQDTRGYDLSATDPNGPIFSYSKPTVNSLGSPLTYGDLWIDTSNYDSYPVIWRWESKDGTDQWIQIDTSDATTENGIVFADARWDLDGTSDVFLDDITPITDLLLSDYIDLDAPEADLYPNGCLLFNTRRSSNNVKKYVQNYFTIEDFPQLSLPDVKATWQSYSGKKYNNVPFFGRQAVRNVVVSAMQQAVENSTELREEGRAFNLLVAPGYPELLDTLKMLNDDRKNTGFVIGEVPMGLSTDQTVVQNYLIDAVGAGTNGEDGLTTNDAYSAVFYPGAATVPSLTGVGSVVVPTSAIMLRTMIRSDQVSDVWFAPAGNARGVLDCISIGYVDRGNNNAFVSTGVPQGLRDLLYSNRVNPLVYFPQVGRINYGNHTRQAEATALDRINVARLVAYLRGRLEQIVRPLVFEPNDKITRDKAKAICDQLLNDVAARRGVYDFLVVCDRSNNTNATIDRNELHIDIAIEPVKSVEFIYIPVRIKATGQLRSGNVSATVPVGQ